MEHCHGGTDTWFPAAADVAQFQSVSETFVLLRKNSKSALAGEDRLDEYCVDILRQMALLLEFRFELRLVRDGTYGIVNTRGEWSGIIREVMDREESVAPIIWLRLGIGFSESKDSVLPTPEFATPCVGTMRSPTT
ncbi:hypothetical protein MRX96_048849 [Rhipicephalus microplus]